MTAKYSWLRNNSQIATFLVCVLISFCVWIANALNQVHESKLIIPIHLDKDKWKVDVNSKTAVNFELTISGRGFDLMYLYFENPFNKFELSPSYKNEKANNVNLFTAANSVLLNYNKDLKVIKTDPEWLAISTIKKYNKKVALVPKVNLKFNSNYMQSGKIILVPDSILLSSLEPIDDHLNSIEMQMVSKKNLNKSVFQSVVLINPSPSKITIASEKKNWIYIPVEEATEKTLIIPISMDEKMSRRTMTIPSVVSLKCRVPTKYYDRTTIDKFKVVATISNAQQQMSVVSISKAPFWCDRLLWNPLTVHYINSGK
jgi:hypothetical protein